jgi:hypothetical protein
MATRADIPLEDVTGRYPPGTVSMLNVGWHSQVASRTKRSLLLAALTFLCAGAYYRGASVSLLDSAGRHDNVRMLRLARSSALFAISEMKQALAERWADRRIAGTYDQAAYRAVAVLRRNRGTVHAVGIALSGGEEELSYQVRADVLRRPRTTADASSGYDVIMKAPATETEHHAIWPFVESSNRGD